MTSRFKLGDRVIWAKWVSGEFCFPVQATVRDVTAKRVTISAYDPGDRSCPES